MSDLTASETPSAPRINEPFRVETDAYGFYWRNRPENTLPPPDLVGAYNRSKPLPRAGVENRKAYIVGGGIAGLAAAFYLIRDGHMPGRNITILDADDIAGGSLDGAGDAETGYILRGGREMCFTYENFWDVFQDVPALELPQGFSVLDEYRLLNDNDPTYSKARLMHRQGEIKDFSTFGLSRSQQWELTRLLFKRKEELDDITVEQYFSKGFLQTNFWLFWRTMFAFQNWHSLLEMKLYMHRFLDLIDGLNDLSSLVYAKYNQYDSFVRPLLGWLSDKGVQTQFDTRVHDLAVEIEGPRKTVTKVLCSRHGRSETIPVGPDDIVIALTGSMTEGTAYGDFDHAPALAVDRHSPGPESGWALWRNLAAKSPAFGKPEKFYGDVDRSIWESATLTCRPSPLVEKLKTLAVNDPYSGKAVTGGIITFADSSWLLSFTCGRQPHFPNQPKDVLVLWAYALFMDRNGDFVKKPMPACTGREILAELCFHLGIADVLDEVAANTRVRTALMPYITAQFMPRAAGDRPRIVPEGCVNLALVGQFVETSNDVVFTVESSVRTGRVAAYSLLGLPKQVPDISPTQYDIRTLAKAARTLNNDEPFLGERLLHRFLAHTYFAHILPPLPDEGSSRLSELEEEVRVLVGKSGEAMKEASNWFVHALRGLSKKDP
jgi:oleate hydratase